MPVYLGLRETSAEKVILIYSSETKAQAVQIKTDVCAENPGCRVEMFELNPYDYNQIRTDLKSLMTLLSGNIVEVNVSGGTKPWSIVFAMLTGRCPNLRLIYVDQNNVIYDCASSEKHCFTSLLSIEQIFKYNQTVVQSHKSLDEYTEEDKTVLRDIKEIRNKYNRGKHSLFNALTIPSNKKARNVFINNDSGTYVDPESCSEIKWDKKFHSDRSEETSQYVRLYFVDKLGSHEEFELISPHAFDMVIFSGWFEYEVATILRNSSECKEVWLNTIFPYKNKRSKNEIDIIALIDNKLLFIECKTQVFDNTDIDKFTSAVKNYGGLGAKAIFITQMDMGEESKEKCETNKIAHFSFHDKKNKKANKQELFEMLKIIMENGNTR